MAIGAHTKALSRLSKHTTASFLILPVRSFHCAHSTLRTRNTSPRCSAPIVRVLVTSLPKGSIFVFAATQSWAVVIAFMIARQSTLKLHHVPLTTNVRNQIANPAKMVIKKIISDLEMGLFIFHLNRSILKGSNMPGKLVNCVLYLSFFYWIFSLRQRLIF